MAETFLVNTARDKNKIEKKKKVKHYFQVRRKAALAILGDKCIKCGFDDPRALQIDHIHGNGAKDRKSITKVYWNAVIESVIKEEDKYQLLCANCNWIKRYENKEY